jgi:hypothetical protein
VDLMVGLSPRSRARCQMTGWRAHLAAAAIPERRPRPVHRGEHSQRERAECVRLSPGHRRRS